MADRIDYIKDSVDTLHLKVDSLRTDVDTRLKSLEITRANERGFMRAVSLVSAAVGSAIALVASYFIYHKS